MTPLTARLFFSHPLMPLHEALHVLRLTAQISDPAALFHILASQRTYFTHYADLLSLLKDHYGFIEEENPFKKARIASEKHSQEEKIRKGLGQEEKEAIAFVQKTFQGRILYHRSHFAQD